MKKTLMALTALAATVVAAPAFTGTAEAHPRGEICYFQKIDRDNIVRTGSDYCHHLPSGYREKPRAGFNLYFNFGNNGWYYDRNPRFNRRQEQVCLVTFFKRSQVAAGADANVDYAQVLPRREAERRDGPNDRRRIFDYGSNRETRETCRYLNSINN